MQDLKAQKKEDNIGNTLFNIGLSNIFLDLSPQAGKNSKSKQMGLNQTRKL